MNKRVARPGVRKGYDTWAKSYDATPNPLVVLDRRHTLRLLRPRNDERILDAGCGTGAHLRTLIGAGSRPVGIDFSHGMLRVARRTAPRAPVAQADLNHPLPIERGVFDAFLCALVSEHLTSLHTLFAEAFAVLRRGGRLMFSAFHPELAASGIEANFQHRDKEYRLGAEPHTVGDYLQHIHDAGFRGLCHREFLGDEALACEVPGASKYLGRPILMTVEAIRPRAG